MPAKKKTAAVKKAVAKRTPKDKAIYIVSKRSKMFLWTPVAAFQAADRAREYADMGNYPYAVDMYKVTPVKLDA